MMIYVLFFLIDTSNICHRIHLSFPASFNPTRSNFGSATITSKCSSRLSHFLRHCPCHGGGGSAKTAKRHRGGLEEGLLGTLGSFGLVCQGVPRVCLRVCLGLHRIA